MRPIIKREACTLYRPTTIIPSKGTIGVDNFQRVEGMVHCLLRGRQVLNHWDTEAHYQASQGYVEVSSHFVTWIKHSPNKSQQRSVQSIPHKAVDLWQMIIHTSNLSYKLHTKVGKKSQIKNLCWSKWHFQHLGIFGWFKQKRVKEHTVNCFIFMLFLHFKHFTETLNLLILKEFLSTLCLTTFSLGFYFLHWCGFSDIQLVEIRIQNTANYIQVNFTVFTSCSYKK